jgi:hypothetical protein
MSLHKLQDVTAWTLVGFLLITGLFLLNSDVVFGLELITVAVLVAHPTPLPLSLKILIVIVGLFLLPS